MEGRGLDKSRKVLYKLISNRCHTDYSHTAQLSLDVLFPLRRGISCLSRHVFNLGHTT